MAKDDAPNSAGDRYNQVGAAASLDEIYARTRRMSEVNTVAGERLRQEGRSVRTNLRNLKEAHSLLSSPGVPRTPEIAAGLTQNRDEYAAALAERSAVSQRFYEEKQVAIHRAGQSFQSQINQFTGSRQQASRINEAYSSTSSLDAAARQMNTTGYSGFESMAQGGAGQARAIATQLREAAVNGAPEARVRELGGQLTAAESQIGVGRRGMQMTRQMGQDPQSQFLRINETAARAQERIGGEALREKAAAGELPSLKELNEQIKEAAQELNALKESFAEGKKPLDDFNKEAGAVADKLTKLEHQEKAVKEASGGGGGNFLGVNTGIARAGIDALRQATINQPIQALNVKAQMAQAQNEQFHTVDAALHGDMSALGLLGSNAFGNAAGFARQQQLSQKILQTADVGADVLDAGTGALNLSSVINPGNAAGKIAQHIASSATTASDLAQGVTAGETSVQAYQAAMNAQRTINEIPSEFRQSYFDYGKTVTSATRSAGAGREKMIGDLMDMSPKGLMNSMADMGVDPNRTAGFVGQGLAEQGSAFDTKQIKTARGLEIRGFGSMEENMRRMGGLANAGAANANDSMGKVMEEAVSKGMDTSKAVSLMTDGISHLAQTSGMAQSGVDSTAGLAALLGAALGGKDGRSDVSRSAAAQSGIQSASDLLGDTSVSYTNMVRDTKFRQMGMTGLQAAAARHLTSEDLSVLGKGGPEAVRLAHERGGLGLFDVNGKFNTKKVNQLIDIQGGFLEEGGASGLGMTMSDSQHKATHAALRKQSQGKKLSAAEQRAVDDFNAMQTAQGVKSTTGLGNVVGGRFGADDTISTAAQKEAHNRLNGVGAGKETQGAEAVQAAGTKMDAAKVKAGSKDLESMSKIAEVLGSISKAMTPAMMEHFAKAAGDASGKMQIGAENMNHLNTATGKLSTTFDTLKTNIDNLNTSIINIGGFKTADKANKPVGPAIKHRLDRLTGH